MVLAVVLFFGVLLLGERLVSGIALHGPLALLSSVIQSQLLDRYDRFAWVGLLSFLGLAVKLSSQD